VGEKVPKRREKSLCNCILEKNRRRDAKCSQFARKRGGEVIVLKERKKGRRLRGKKAFLLKRKSLHSKRRKEKIAPQLGKVKKKSLNNNKRLKRYNSRGEGPFTL